MNLLRGICRCLLLSVLAIAVSGGVGSAQSPADVLQQYLAELRQRPGDTALREKIIRHVQGMGQQPVVPDEARKRLNRGMAAAEGAKSEAGYQDAIEEFQKAVNAAPWLANGYRGLAIMQDKAGRYEQALQSLKLFLLTNPPAADADAARTLMDKIEYRMEKAAKENSPATVEAKKQAEYAQWLKKLDRAQWRADMQYGCQDLFLELHGNEVRQGWIVTRPTDPQCHLSAYMGEGWEVPGNRYTPLQGRVFGIANENAIDKGTISEDGEFIIVERTPTPWAVQRFGSKPSKESYTRVRNPKWYFWP